MGTEPTAADQSPGNSRRATVPIRLTLGWRETSKHTRQRTSHQPARHQMAVVDGEMAPLPLVPDCTPATALPTRDRARPLHPTAEARGAFSRFSVIFCPSRFLRSFDQSHAHSALEKERRVAIQPPLSDIAFVIPRRQQHLPELAVAVIDNSRVFWQLT